MADIKNYAEERRKREQRNKGNNSGDDIIKRYRMTNAYRRLIVVGVVIAILVLIFVQYKRHIYTSYDVVSTVDRTGAQGAADERLGDYILTHSKDGIHCTDLKGNVTWNQTYQMQDIEIAKCKNTVAVGDYNGSHIYVLNTDKQISEVDTTLPIRQITVSSEGYVAAVLDDENSTFLNTYKPDGTLKYKGETHMNNSGYPAAISLSPNGEMLGVAYWYVDAGVLKSNVVFHNFGPVGGNSNDFVVSAYTYTDLIIPQVQFINDNTAFAVGDSRLIVYQGNHKPIETVSMLFEEELRSVFYNEKYIGLVFRSEDVEHLYRMDVYDAGSKKADNFKVGSFYLDIDYSDIFFTAENFVVYNENQCCITTYKGNVKYNGDFDRKVKLMIPVGKTFKYLLVTDESLDTIQLK